MPSRKKQKILIVEDDLDLAEMLNAYFNMQGYRATTVPWGREAIKVASDIYPDLIVLDIRLPDISGFEVRARLNEGHKTRNIPVIFLTEKTDRVDRLQGLELGVVDYITKPFDIQELRLRVRNTLRRAAEMMLENPVTSLPEGQIVDDALADVIAGRNASRGVLAVTLLGIDNFRELYGFVASDDVLRVTSLTISNAALEIGGEHVFCGHLNEYTFVIILPVDRLETLQQRIYERIGASLEYFYPGDNRGPNAYTDDRLRLLVSQLEIEDDMYRSIDALKLKALQSQQELTA